MDVDDFLEHYGVRGMKWGIRNKRTPVKTSSDYKRVSSLRKKNPSELTNKQLRTLNERMNLEQQYKRLNPGKIHSGKAKVEWILGTAGLGITAYSMLHSPAGKALMRLGKKKAYKQLKLFK